ncbi:MAG: type II toxin-antitoxin system HigB family toxin [Moraxella sp.]|nr:type II toxin-antitoxin system HigB family toxin [Moraxella sp.]
MRVIAKSTLVRFYTVHSDAKAPLEAWHDVAIKANWQSPQDIKNLFASASIVGNNRVVFNIAGNKYRLVVEIAYQIGVIWVKFIGTHGAYDNINVENVNDY